MMRAIDRNQAINPVLQLAAGEVQIEQLMFLMCNVGVAKVFDVIELIGQQDILEWGEMLANRRKYATCLRRW
jgi:hypothetical protein